MVWVAHRCCGPVLLLIGRRRETLAGRRRTVQRAEVRRRPAVSAPPQPAVHLSATLAAARPSPALTVVNAALPRHAIAAASLACLLGGCAARQQQPVATPPASATPAAAPAMAMDHHHHMAGMAPVTIPAGALYTEADVRFMQGMIAHHAQAIYMSRLAATRGADARLLRFAQKIDQSQMGEIVLMQGWLRENQQMAPDTSSWRGMSMPGMLTAEELSGLEAARGTEFDRRFLTLMIRHHEGALKMVADLLASPRAAQDVDVSVLANDVETTQTAEIGLMRQMLAEM